MHKYLFEGLFGSKWYNKLFKKILKVAIHKGVVIGVKGGWLDHAWVGELPWG